MDLSGRHFPKDLILQTVRWYLRYNLSYRDMEEILEERGVEIDHTTPYRWVQEYAPQLEAEHRKRCKVCGTFWRMDETAPTKLTKATKIHIAVQLLMKKLKQ